MAAVQIAKGARDLFIFISLCSYHNPSALGATVIGAAGSQSKLNICKQYGGADYIVDYTKPDWQKEVLQITAGKGVDVIFDPVGKIAGQFCFSSCTYHLDVGCQSP